MKLIVAENWLGKVVEVWDQFTDSPENWAFLLLCPDNIVTKISLKFLELDFMCNSVNDRFY